MNRRPGSVRAAVVLSALAIVAGGCASDSGDSGRSIPTSLESTTTSLPTVDGLPPPATVDAALALDRPVILAHAGGENAHPHSTPYGYADSVAAGVDILDFDVQLSADGVLVVQHDDSVDRTTEASGQVADLTYDQLHALDNAYWFTEACTCRDRADADYVLRGVRTGDRPPPPGFEPDDFAITRFDEIAANYPGFVVNIEIKGSYPDAVPAARELARILEEQGRQDSAVVTAFDDRLAEAFHEALPDVEITPGLTATTEYVLGNVLPPDGRRILQVPPEFQGTTVLTADLVARTKADGLVLWIWPDEKRWENEAGYSELLDFGVGGINAADPRVAVETLRSRLKASSS